jgi:hypothetical protein
MKDILERLQTWRNRMPAKWYGNADLDAAIVEIIRLRTENKELNRRDYIISSNRNSFM